MSTDQKVSPTFASAAAAYAASLHTSAKSEGVKCHAVMTFYAIGFLSKMSRKDINRLGRESSGATEDVWNTGKTVFSRAHRAIAGEYGLGEWLARQWASGVYTVTLDAAYDASAGPKDKVDNVEKVAKLLSNMSAEDVQLTLVRYSEIAETLAYAHQDVQVLVKQRIADIIQVESPKITIAA